MTKSTFDQTIIIGGGHNGLVCAAYLAKAGHQVRVLEAAAQVGGAAITQEFAPGFKVSAGAHLLYMLDPGIRRELKLASHGLKMAATGMPTIALHEQGEYLRFAGGQVDGPGASPGDQQAFQEYHRFMSRFAGVIGSLHNQAPPRMGTSNRRDLFSLARTALRIRRLGVRDMREFLRITGINVFDVLQENFDNEFLKGALSVDGVLGTFLGARSNNSLFCALHRLSNGQDYSLPAGGMGAVSDALANAARSHGAEISTSSPVKRILMDFDRVCGVELDNGEQIQASNVISNADPKTTFRELLGFRHLEAGFAHRISHIRARGHVAKLHLALSGLPAFTGLDATAAGARLLIAPSMQYVEHAFNHAKYGEFSKEPVMEITVPSIHDTGLAPAGQHVLSANVQWAPYELKQGWQDGKAAFTEAAINLLERHAPGIRAQILHAEMLTPPDLEARFRMSGGHWHHAELTMDQFMMMRPVPGSAQYASPVPGLWLCGAGCHPGGGVMGSAGRNAAQAVINSRRG